MTAVLADVSSAQALFDLLEVFKKASGLTINFTKTEGMWIGSSKNNKAKPFGIKWPSEPFYTYDQKLLLEKNFIENVDKIKKLLNVWSSRGLSIYGKVTIIKSLVIPKFVYLRCYWRLNRIFWIMAFFKHMGAYLKWDVYAKFQRSGLKRSQVISERSFVSTGSLPEKNTDCLLRKSFCCLRVQFPKEYDVERSVNSALFYVKDETVLDL